MKTVVTGGAGFIGSHLVERLLHSGHEVVVVDNFYTGRRDNLAAVLTHPRLTIIERDICEGLVSECAGAHALFHLAAMADIVPSIEEPTRYYEANVLGTLRVMEAARCCGVPRVLYVASSSCYGIPAQYPTPESAPIRPQYPYALTKWLGEATALHWGRVYNIGVVSLRLFNVFGPRHRTTGAYGAVFGVFLAQKLANQPLTIVGDGSQTRDFTWVSDVVDAMTAAMDSGLCDAVMNVGSGGTYAVRKLARLIGGPTVSIPKRPGEPDCTFADITQIRRLLGWTPSKTFEEGVAEMLRHIEVWRDAPVWTPDTIRDATASWFAHLGSGRS